MSLKYAATTEQIIGAAYAVHDYLGFGFLEKVYENAMVVELRKRGQNVVQQFPMKVWYYDTVVGEYACDLLVEDKVLVELKSVKDLAEFHHAQIINYLRAIRLEVGLLINFGRKLDVKRKILDVNCPDQGENPSHSKTAGQKGQRH